MGEAHISQVGGDQYVEQHVYGPGAGPAPLALNGLPAAPTDLVGRQDQVQELLDLLDPTQRRASTATISVVVGLAGIGKTALALHVAHEAVARGWFPGGALFVPLRGYDPVGPVRADQALGSLLRALGVRDTDLPSTSEGQAALYRSELAHRATRGERILVMADDAATTAQVQLLIPAGPVHRVLVTSRDMLVSPTFPARLTRVDELALKDAIAMTIAALLRARPYDPRAGREPDALAQVAVHCGRLPLALQIVAALLTADPGLPIATLASDLADTRTRLEALQYDDNEQSLAVRAAFDLSYRRLRPQQARLFRLLSANPGPDLATDGAAALICQSVRQTRGILSALTQASLLNEQPTGSDRWRMHDLIRLYSAELGIRSAGKDRRGKAVDRLLDHYCATADAATDHYKWSQGQTAAPRFTDRHNAVAWLVHERPNLVSATSLAAATGRPRTVLVLASCLARFLNERRHFDDAIAIGRSAVTAAQQIRDRYNEGHALNSLSRSLLEVRRIEEAVATSRQAIDIYRDLKDREDEGIALKNLGSALGAAGRTEEAIATCQQAVDICRKVGLHQGEGQALNSLGAMLLGVGRFEEAIASCQHAVDIFIDLTDRHRASAALNNLGLALLEVGRFEEAIASCQHAVDICIDLTDRPGEATASSNLGNALYELGRFNEAVSSHQRVLAIRREVDDRHGEAEALNNLGSALRRLRRFDEARNAHQQAVAIFRDLGDRDCEGPALNDLDLAIEEGTGWGRRVWRAVTGRQIPQIRPSTADSDSPSTPPG
ncbi:ATP-binding protein [Streptomyces sp. NPDC058476]|uniref:ATP-binding protein n=1 Tax=Streptomyces sp. NPDC058476 TaxID=3346519 RepID=UPI003659D65B